MTRMTPLRLMILQFSQSFLTDARTFIILNRFRFQNDAALGQITGCQFEPDFISGIRRETQARFAGHKPQKPMPIRKLHTIRLVRQNFNYNAFNFEGSLSRHVNISGSDSVMSTVCSKWADNEPSSVTTVQSSFNIFPPGNPGLPFG